MNAQDPHLRHLGRPLVPGCPDCDRQLAQLPTRRSAGQRFTAADLEGVPFADLAGTEFPPSSPEQEARNSQILIAAITKAKARSQRMTAEREAEVREKHRPVIDDDGENVYCWECMDPVHGDSPTYADCEVIEALDALAAERAHAQQIEVPHASAAVLGYLAAYRHPDGSYSLPADMGALWPTQEQVDAENWSPRFVIAAVVRVGADGRIGS